MVKIEKGIPIPEGRGRATKWPWRDLAVGDSFLMRGKTIRSAGAGEAARRCGIRLLARTVEGGVRVWRVE